MGPRLGLQRPPKAKSRSADSRASCFRQLLRELVRFAPRQNERFDRASNGLMASRLGQFQGGQSFVKLPIQALRTAIGRIAQRQKQLDAFKLPVVGGPRKAKLWRAFGSLNGIKSLRHSGCPLAAHPKALESIARGSLTGIKSSTISAWPWPVATCNALESLALGSPTPIKSFTHVTCPCSQAASNAAEQSAWSFKWPSKNPTHLALP